MKTCQFVAKAKGSERCICGDTRTNPKHGEEIRWTRSGRMLCLDGKPAIYVAQERDQYHNSPIPVVVCDAIADLLLDTLNKTDLDKLKADWMKKS